jgi:hypothetical protein
LEKSEFLKINFRNIFKIIPRAIDFNLHRLKADGFDEVDVQQVPNLPRWTRGEDRAKMLGMKKVKK